MTAADHAFTAFLAAADPERGGTMTEESAADVAFGAFISTLTPGRVKRERWREPIGVTLTRKYDRETDRLLAQIRRGRLAA